MNPAPDQVHALAIGIICFIELDPLSSPTRLVLSTMRRTCSTQPTSVQASDGIGFDRYVS